MPRSIAMKVFKLFVKVLKKLVTPLHKPTKIDIKDVEFMFCIVEVNILKTGWVKYMAKVRRSCWDVRFHTIDQDGVMTLSGTADPIVLMEAIDKRGGRLKIRWAQFGKCSRFLYGPSPKEISRTQPKEKEESILGNAPLQTLPQSLSTNSMEHINCEICNARSEILNM